ncbi:hypothetical protein ACC734_39930, partial [Rhizobium ruizarguesonis]
YGRHETLSAQEMADTCPSSGCRHLLPVNWAKGHAAPPSSTSTSTLKSGEEGRFIDLTTTCTQPAALGIEEAQALLK